MGCSGSIRRATMTQPAPIKESYSEGKIEFFSRPWVRWFQTIVDSVVTVATTLTPSRLTSTDADGNLVSITDLTTWVSGTANQITSTDDGDGTLTLSVPNNLTVDSREVLRYMYTVTD